MIFASVLTAFMEEHLLEVLTLLSQKWLLSVLQMRKRTETERVIDSLRGCWLLMACILVVIQRTWVGLRPEQILYLYQSV